MTNKQYAKSTQCLQCNVNCCCLRTLFTFLGNQLFLGIRAHFLTSASTVLMYILLLLVLKGILQYYSTINSTLVLFCKGRGDSNG